MTTDHDSEFEPPHASSPTDRCSSELRLYGYRPFHDEPDPRRLPEGGAVVGAVADIFGALVSTLSDTRLEPDLDDLLWSTVNLFHRAVDRIEHELDDNEQAQLSLSMRSVSLLPASKHLHRTRHSIVARVVAAGEARRRHFASNPPRGAGGPADRMLPTAEQPLLAEYLTSY